MPSSNQQRSFWYVRFTTITNEIAYRMKAMVGFRNIAVHDYQAINQGILQQILDKYLNDFTTYTEQILDY